LEKSYILIFICYIVVVFQTFCWIIFFSYLEIKKKLTTVDILPLAYILYKNSER